MYIHFLKNIVRIEILHNGIPVYEKTFGWVRDFKLDCKIGDTITLRDPSGWGYGGLVNYKVIDTNKILNIDFKGFFNGQFILS